MDKKFDICTTYVPPFKQGVTMQLPAKKVDFIKIYHLKRIGFIQYVIYLLLLFHMLFLRNLKGIGIEKNYQKQRN